MLINKQKKILLNKAYLKHVKNYNNKQRTPNKYFYEITKT